MSLDGLDEKILRGREGRELGAQAGGVGDGPDVHDVAGLEGERGRADPGGQILRGQLEPDGVRRGVAVEDPRDALQSGHHPVPHEDPAQRRRHALVEATGRVHIGAGMRQPRRCEQIVRRRGNHVGECQLRRFHAEGRAGEEGGPRKRWG